MGEVEEPERHFIGLRVNGEYVARFELVNLSWEKVHEIASKLDEIDWLHVDFVVTP